MPPEDTPDHASAYANRAKELRVGLALRLSTAQSLIQAIEKSNHKDPKLGMLVQNIRGAVGRKAEEIGVKGVSL